MAATATIGLEQKKQSLKDVQYKKKINHSKERLDDLSKKIT